MKRAPQTPPVTSLNLSHYMSLYDDIERLNPDRWIGCKPFEVAASMQTYIGVQLDLYDELTFIEYIMHRREMKKPR